MVSPMKSALILSSFLTVALHETGTRKALLGPWLNNAEVYFTALLVLKITQLKNNNINIVNKT
jgi:hypothetical protein